MSKGNKTLIALLALVLTCVVGYALFSETITVSGTATASGTFDIGFKCTTVTPTGTATGDCSIAGQTIITKSNLTKPSEKVKYLVTLTNDGTIPAVLKTIDSPNNYSGDGDSLTTTNANYYMDLDNLVHAYYSIGGIDFEDNNYDDLIESKNITLQPDESIVLEIEHGWIASDSEIEQPEIPAEGTSISYNIELGFEQILAE